MSVRNIPGFTAEASLYRRGRSYRMAAGAEVSGIVPQIRRCTDCDDWATGSRECCDYEWVCPNPEDPEDCGYDFINCQSQRCGVWATGVLDWLIFA